MFELEDIQLEETSRKRNSPTRVVTPGTHPQTKLDLESMATNLQGASTANAIQKMYTLLADNIKSINETMTKNINEREAGKKVLKDLGALKIIIHPTNPVLKIWYA